MRCSEGAISLGEVSKIMFRSIGTTELLIVAAVILFLFGGKKIPELFKGMAEAVKEFKKASKNTDTDKEEKEA